MNTIASGLEVSRGELGGHQLIGYLIACRKRQQYVKLCEADLENRDPGGWRPDGRLDEVSGRKIFAHVGRSANRPWWALFA